ncbi:MAG: hypothetical protein R3C02_25890 [Planctomycetaceae bacterium]
MTSPKNRRSQRLSTRMSGREMPSGARHRLIAKGDGHNEVLGGGT